MNAIAPAPRGVKAMIAPCLAPIRSDVEAKLGPYQLLILGPTAQGIGQAVSGHISSYILLLLALAFGEAAHRPRPFSKRVHQSELKIAPATS